ncbi:hypothetical protein BDZ91DRAFT_720239 [Kalaharituber pfeilii]|nr:hypothetical protein BDZ91DRAFT_720239 [Kalaharituber pfeilii]
MYIRQSKIHNLKAYQYSGYILKPFYTNVVIKCFPLWMAEITLSGFSFVVLNILTLLWYTPGLDQECPPWVYLSWSIGLFLYQTFDAVDGSQARRTRQSGPLGELFDHGVDACNTTLEVVIFAAVMNLGYSWATVMTMFASLCAFYLTTWEEYHTGILYLGLVSGPVEGVLTLCVVYAFTALVGGSFWQRPLLEVLGFGRMSWLPQVFQEMPICHWYLVYGGIMLGFNIIQSSLNVIRVRRSKNLPVLPALAGLIPFFSLATMVCIWLALRPIILRAHLLPFMFFVGASFAYQVGLIIVAHLTRSPFPHFNILLLPIAFGLVDALGPFLKEYTAGLVGWPSALGDEVYEVAYVLMCLGLAVGVYGSFVVDVVTNICDYLDIWCLTIKHKYGPETQFGDKGMKVQ